MLRALTSAGATLIAASTCLAGSHLWEFNEVFSSPDGKVQFIELHVPVNANFETALAGKKIKSAATGKEFTFPSNLTPPTGFKYLLLATAEFAALPGAPAPDYILPENFLGTNGDTLTWHVYDTWILSPGELPLDCVSSLNENRPLVADNTPRNYAGAEATVDACPVAKCLGDLDGSNDITGADMGILLGAWGTGNEQADLDTNGIVDAADLAILLGAWGACP